MAARLGNGEACHSGGGGAGASRTPSTGDLFDDTSGWHNTWRAIMSRTTNRRDFVRAAGLAASGLLAAAAPLAAAAQAQARPAPRTMGARFRALMNGPDPLICPGAYDLMSARLCAVHGF